MKYAHLIPATAMAGLLATSAMAGEFSKAGASMAEPPIAPVAEPVAPAQFSWTGGYAGLGLGYGNMDFRGAGSASSGAAGLFGGYRQDMGGFVLGGEALVVPYALGGGVTLPGGDTLDYGATLMATAGMPFGAEGRTLGYVGIGPSLARSSGAAGSENSIGGTAAVGLDHMLTDQIMLRGGVNYSVINNVGSADVNTRTLGGGVGVAFRF